MPQLNLGDTLEAFSKQEPSRLGEIRRGIEKEGLRVNRNGLLSQKPHPKALGSALTHPHITTDFSEAQLELITGVHDDIESLLAELTGVHQFVCRHISPDLLWSNSMPCQLEGDEQIPIGQYGHANIARLKSVYRMGLALRYGKTMQTISGIHYNFSLSDDFWQQLKGIERSPLSLQQFKTQRNFDLIRNFRQQSWLPIYLLGASPAISKTFKNKGTEQLEQLGQTTLFKPYGTSLRMSKIGYQSEAQRAIRVSFNSLKDYTRSIRPGLTHPHPSYQAYGIQDNAGHYRQLNTSLLQIENEFYNVIRPKCLVQSHERPLNALTKRGVEYVELRLVDLNPFVPIGIEANTIRLLDLLLLKSLFTDSPADVDATIDREEENRQRTVEEGRLPGLRLHTDRGEVPLVELGDEILTHCEPIAQALDKNLGGHDYQETLSLYQAQLERPELTLSGRIMALLDGQKLSFLQLTTEQSTAHADWLKQAMDPKQEALMIQQAEQSHQQQVKVEQSDELDFETFRKNYIEQPLP